MRVPSAAEDQASLRTRKCTHPTMESLENLKYSLGCAEESVQALSGTSLQPGRRHSDGTGRK